MTRRAFTYLRLTLLGVAVLALLVAVFLPQPLQAALIVFGLSTGSAWLVGLFISNRLRRQELRKAIDGDR